MKRATTPNPITLAAGMAAYLEHEGAAGKRPSTVGTVKRSLALLAAHLGEDKEVGQILAQNMAGFLKSEAATLQRGKPRAEASSAQIRRIVRAALAWWREQGYGERAPLPASEEPVVEPEEKKEETPCRKDEDADAPSAAPPAPSPDVPPAALPSTTQAASPHPQPTTTTGPLPATPPPTEPTRTNCLELTYQGQLARFSKTEVPRVGGLQHRYEWQNAA